VEDARVAARARLEARAQLAEQLLDHFGVAQPCEGAAAVGLAVGLAERDQRLDVAAQFLRLRDGRRIVSWRSSEAAMLRSIAQRCGVLRLSCRPVSPCLICSGLDRRSVSNRPPITSHRSGVR
jgi:hypothetical protein